MKRCLFFISLAALTVALPSMHEGTGCKVFRIANTGNVQNGVDKLHNLAADGHYDFWTDIHTNKSTDVFVPPHKLEAFENFMKQHGFTYSAMIEDVGKHVRRERAINRPGATMDWENYHRYRTISDFVVTSALTHSDIATVEEIGTTIENRVMIAVKIGKPAQDRQKPAIFMDAGIHAREWISPAVTTYFIDQLLNNRTYYEDILSQVDFYIVPVANPDGYEYTHTDERMWRKNRRPDPECPGVDLNRNFGFHFAGPDSSDEKCSEVYRGTGPFSEPETENIRKFVERKKSEGVNWKAYFAMHSYSQVWLLPWSWTDEVPEDYEELKRFAEAGVKALIPFHGTTYELMAASNFYFVGGSSQDWAKGSGYFKYAQTVELRDTGDHGFILPTEQIIPTAEETWAAIQASARYLAEKQQRINNNHKDKPVNNDDEDKHLVHSTTAQTLSSNSASILSFNCLLLGAMYATFLGFDAAGSVLVTCK